MKPWIFPLVFLLMACDVAVDPNAKNVLGQQCYRPIHLGIEVGKVLTAGMQEPLRRHFPAHIRDRIKVSVRTSDSDSVALAYVDDTNCVIGMDTLNRHDYAGLLGMATLQRVLKEDR